MVQQVKGVAMQPGDQSSIPEAHVKQKERTDSTKLSSHLRRLWHLCTHTHKHTDDDNGHDEEEKEDKCSSES